MLPAEEGINGSSRMLIAAAAFSDSSGALVDPFRQIGILRTNVGHALET